MKWNEKNHSKFLIIWKYIYYKYSILITNVKLKALRIFFCSANHMEKQNVIPNHKLKSWLICFGQRQTTKG